jgi:hypothetical protein
MKGFNPKPNPQIGGPYIVDCSFNKLMNAYHIWSCSKSRILNRVKAAS